MEMSRLETKLTITIILICAILMMGMIEDSHAANSKNKDDLFNINITMPKFNTTQV